LCLHSKKRKSPKDDGGEKIIKEERRTRDHRPRSVSSITRKGEKEAKKGTKQGEEDGLREKQMLVENRRNKKKNGKPRGKSRK